MVFMMFPTWPIPWRLMPGLLVLPGHQLPWYWPSTCKVDVPVASMRNCFRWLQHRDVWNGRLCKHILFSSSEFCTPRDEISSFHWVNQEFVKQLTLTHTDILCSIWVNNSRICEVCDMPKSPILVAIYAQSISGNMRIYDHHSSC